MHQSRFEGADFLRACACLMVLLHHLAFRLDMGKAPEAVVPLLQFGVMGSFGVAVFFVLSGFLLARPFWLALDQARPMPSLRTYALRRAARIVPGFWLALTVSFALSITLFGIAPDLTLIVRFLAGLFLVSDWHWLTLFPVENNGPLWSIGFEVSSYLFLPLCLAALFALRNRLKSPWASRALWLAAIAIVLVLHATIVRWAPIDEMERGWEFGIVGGAKAWMPRFNPIGFFAIFAIGALAAGVQVRLNTMRSWTFDGLGVAGFIAAIALMIAHIGGLNEGFGFLGIPYGFPAYPLAIALMLAVLPSTKAFNRLIGSRIIHFIAEISFGIYVWHFLLIGIAVRFGGFNNEAPDVWANWLLSSAIVTVLSFAIATLSFYRFEKPIVRWARGLEKPQP